MMGFGFFGFLILLVLGGLLVAGIPVLERLFSSNSNADANSSSGASAEEILDQRYARGEIGRDEYQRAKQDLKD